MPKKYFFPNLVGYYVCWIACVLGAAKGLPWLGPVTVLAFVALHLAMVKDRLREGVFLAGAAVVGFFLDTGLAAAGLYSFHLNSTVPTWVSPLWMVALWPAFGAVMNASMAFMSGRWPLLGVFGALGGPLAYYAGASLGAIKLSDPLWLPLLALGVAWGVATPALMWGATRHDAWRTRVPDATAA